MATKSTKENIVEDAKEIANEVKNTAKEIAAETKETAKKTASKAKSTAKKTAAKAASTAKKTAAKAVKTKTSTRIQFMGRDIAQSDLESSALAQFADLYPEIPAKTMELYVNIDDSAAYYVINGEHTGCIHF